MMRFRVPFSLDKGWQFISTSVIIAACVSLLLFNRLDTLLPGYNQTELDSSKTASGISQIVKNPVNAPYKIAVLVFSVLTEDKLQATRLAAASFAAVTLALFYIGARHWYRRRIAFLAAVLFACSSWFLHVGRFGSADILLPCSILLLAVCGYWIATARHDAVSSITAVLALGLCVYVPGIIWFLIPALIVRWDDVARLLLDLTWVQRIILFGLTIGFVILPLTFAILSRPQLGIDLLGLPDKMPVPLDVLQNIAALPAVLFLWAPTNPAMQLGHLPLVGIFTTAMFLLGIYYYARFRFSLARTKLLAVYFVISGALIALDGTVGIALLLPGIFVVATAGIAALWRQWTAIFPRNPVAKSLGIGLIAIAVTANCIYNLRAYFIAWPHNQETVKAYQITDKNLVQ